MRGMDRKCKSGKLIRHGVRLKLHEQATVEYFLRRGEAIELLVPSNTMKNKNPDWILRGKIWEAKSPQTNNVNTLLVMLKRALKQSGNLVLDLRRVKGDDKRVARIVQTKFMSSKRFKNLLIIMKNGELIELKKS